MSIEKMISEHPQVGSGYNGALGQAVKHAMYCAAICNSCADACSAEDTDMRQCIRTCMDCSDVCEATYRVATRRTGENRQLIRTMLATSSRRLRERSLTKSASPFVAAAANAPCSCEALPTQWETVAIAAGDAMRTAAPNTAG